ncbi:MAG TPA: hypothetical protein PK280_04575 [Planctomycetota bacterium]|nr:hypothetical protein [Planctomycetota bacterium]
MAVNLPDPLRRREILYGVDTPAATLSEYGQAYEEEGRFDDALQFFEQARDAKGLGRIKEQAFKLGDAFMLKRIAKAMPEMATPADWERMAKRAEELGKNLFAEQARQALAGHLEAVEPEEKQGLGKA